MVLDKQLKSLFSEDAFDEIMQLQGEVFRELEGRKTIRVIWNGEAYFIKQHFGVGWKEIIKNLFQLRLPVVSAKNEWQALHRLTELTVSVPEVVGYDARGCNPAHKRSFLITRELPKHISLEHLCQTWPQNPPSFIFKQQLINKVAEIARVLHDNGINHRDFYICHFLLDLTEKKAADVKLYLIDLHRAQIRACTPERWRIKDLAGLYFSSKEIGLTKRDLLRFIKKYRNKPLREVFNREINFWLKVKERGDQLYRKHNQ